MALCSVSFFGSALGMHATMDVIVPSGPGPFPVLYLLHGFSDDHTGWRKNVPIERFMEKRPMIVVMPAGGKGYYLNDPRPTGLALEDHILKDVIGFVDQTFRTIPTRQGRGVAGNSMGGFGALMLTLKHPDLFSAASAMSGAVYFLSMAHPKKNPHQTALMEILAGESGVFDLAAKVKAAGQYRFVDDRTPACSVENALAVRMDCGSEDFLIEPNRRFHKHLETIGVTHQYDEFPGVHDWQYWTDHVGLTLDFMQKHLTPGRC